MPGESVSQSPSEYIFVDPHSIERHMRKEARKLFVLERADILIQLPDSYKRCFNHVMFWRRDKYPMPVLIVSCYDVPPGPLRSRWMARFLQVRNSNDDSWSVRIIILPNHNLLKEREKGNGLQDMPLLAYQYGVRYRISCTNGSIEDAYTFMELANNDCVPYEEGVVKGFDQIPREIQRKILLQLPLDDEDRLALDALKEMQEDSHSRRGGFPQFEEGYSLICCETKADKQQSTSQGLEMPSEKTPTTPALPELSMESPLPNNMAKIKEGSRIEVYWPEDKEYYPARVTQVRGSFYHILYDDGEEEWLPLAEHDFLLQEDGHSSSVQVSKIKSMNRWVMKDDDGDEGDDREFGSEEDVAAHKPKKASHQCKRRLHKRSKSLSMGSSDDEPSKYLRTSGDRLTKDGCIIPKQKLRRLADGTYAIPKGRHPLGTYFDSKRGVFVYQSKRVLPDENFSDREVVVDASHQPIKKRKLVD